jgi:hypothetical protein
LATTAAPSKINSGHGCPSDAHQGLVAKLSRRWVARVRDGGLAEGAEWADGVREAVAGPEPP